MAVIVSCKGSVIQVNQMNAFTTATMKKIAKLGPKPKPAVVISRFLEIPGRAPLDTKENGTSDNYCTLGLCVAPRE